MNPEVMSETDLQSREPMPRRLSQRQSGSTTGSLLLLLILIAGVGGWNYHRNYKLDQEQQGKRPYASYAAKDLVSLRDAYQAELVGSKALFDQAKSRRQRPQSHTGSFAGNVDQFASTAKTSNAIRKAAAGVSSRQQQVDELNRELAIRENLGEGLALHLKRLTRF